MFYRLKRISIFISGVLIFLSACEKVDDTPPVVTVTFPAVGITVSEIVNVTCVASDNVGIDHVELWIDGATTGLADDTEPYGFIWNTTEHIDGSTHSIVVRAYDESDNSVDSEPVVTTIDQTDSYPAKVNITSVTYNTTDMTVSWERSPDTDFQRYELYKAADTTSYSLLATIEHQDTLSFVMAEFDPQVDNYFRITTYDTLGLSKQGQYLSNDLHTEPNPVDITEVSYTYTEMTISWEEYEADPARIATLSKKLGKISGTSQWTDFISYELVHATLADTVWTSLVTITDMNTTSFTLSEFDPTHENLFGIIVTDFWGLTSMGMELSNTVEPAPQQSEIYPMDYTSSSITISWSANSEDDFVGYELYESLNSDMSTSNLIYSSEAMSDTSFVVSGAAAELSYYYQVRTTDLWGLSNLSMIHLGFIQIVFQTTYGGSADDTGQSVEQTSDGGFIMAGVTKSFGNGLLDVWLIKTNAYGVQEWNRTFGGDAWDEAFSVQQTSDGGYILAGHTGSYDVWLIKTDASGNEEWNQTFGAGRNIAYSVCQTSDGGYILVGETTFGGSLVSDVLLIKTDGGGNEEWNQTFGGDNIDVGQDVQQTSDGGFILIGSTAEISFGAVDHDLWLIKTDGSGNEEWNKTFGRSGNQYGFSVDQTSDGGLILGGTTPVMGAFHGDAWLIKTDAAGNEEWDQTFGEFHYDDSGRSVQQTLDGGFILAGYTYTYGNGHSDAWLIKTDGVGNEEWNRTFGGTAWEMAYSVQQTSSGGFILAGWTESYGLGESDAWLIKTDPWGYTVN